MMLHTAAAVVAALFLASCVFGHTVALRLLLLGTGLALAAMLAVRERDSIRRLPPVWLPFLLWAAWALLSLAWSIEPGRTWKEWQNEMFYAGAGLWICYVAAQSRDATRIFLSVVGIAMVVSCAVALYEFSRGWDRYLVGWHGGPGDHSSALVVVMPCFVMAGWYGARARWPRWVLASMAGIALVLFASGYTTLNRTIWLAFAVQFVLLGFLMLARARMKKAALIVAVTVAAGCGAILFNLQAEREAVVATKSIEQDNRLALWPRIMERIHDRPATGYGFGRGLLRDSLQQEFASVDQHLWHAHNIFLEALLQLGIPGLVLLCLLMGFVLREGWRLSRQANEASVACGMALMAVLAGMLVRNMTDSLLVRQNALLFWGVVGVLLGIGGRTWQARS